MDRSEKTVRLITQLNRLTKENIISWTFIRTPPGIAAKASNDIFTDCYKTEYKEREFIIFVRRYLTYDDDYDKEYWNDELVFGIIVDENLVWERSGITGLRELAETVKMHVADIDGILDDVLNDDSKIELD